MCMFRQKKKHIRNFTTFLKTFILLCKIMRSRSYREFYVYMQFFVIISTSFVGRVAQSV